MQTEAARKAFFATLHAAIDRKALPETQHRVFPDQAAAFGQTMERSHILPISEQERALWMASFIEEAKLLSIETSVLDSPDRIGQTVADIAMGIPTEWSPVKTAVCSDQPLIRRAGIDRQLAALDIPVFFPEESDESEIFRKRCAEATLGIFTADAAIAESATLVVRTTPQCPRIVSLLPSASIAVVPMDTVLDTFSRLSWMLSIDPASDGMTFITGASKTADIEAVMVPGAHGPRSLHILFVPDGLAPTP